MLKVLSEPRRTTGPSCGSGGRPSHLEGTWHGWHRQRTLFRWSQASPSLPSCPGRRCLLWSVQDAMRRAATRRAPTGWSNLSAVALPRTISRWCHSSGRLKCRHPPRRAVRTLAGRHWRRNSVRGTHLRQVRAPGASSQGREQVRGQVISFFDPDGQPHQVAGYLQNRAIRTRVRHSARVLDQRFHATE